MKSSQSESLSWPQALCHLTARQYGEVVLPDASTGQGPGTLASKLSRCKEGMAHFLPSWYKLSRSQKFITVQDFNCGQMRVSGCNNHYKSVLGAGAKAKSVTNNLPILSVLAAVIVFLMQYKQYSKFLIFNNLSL